MVGTVSSDCPSSQELLRQQLALRAAGWDRPASSLRLQGSFIHLSLAANITVCNLSYPIPRIHANLISLKYYYYSPWAARSRNKAISKQPPNPTGQVPQILQGKKIHTLRRCKLNQSAMLWMKFIKPGIHYDVLLQ